MARLTPMTRVTLTSPPTPTARVTPTSSPTSMARVTPTSMARVTPTPMTRVTLTSPPTPTARVTPTSSPMSMARVTPTSMARMTPTSMARMTPTSMARVTPTSMARVTPTSMARVTPTSMARVTPTSMARVTPTSPPTPMARMTPTSPPTDMARVTHSSPPTPVTRVPHASPPTPMTRATPTPAPTPITRRFALGHQGRNPRLSTKKDFTRKRDLAEVLELICQESTAHGIGHTWNNRRNPLGVFWFFVTVTLFVLLLFLSARLVRDFMQRDIQSQTTVKLAKRGQLQLPSIVLCNRHFFSKWKLKAFNISSRLTNYLIAITGSIFFVREKFLVTSEGQAFLRDSHSQLLSLMLAHNLTHSQLIDAISYRCEELVLQCGIGNHMLDTAECCEEAVVTPTMTGKCYTYFGAANHTQTIEGEHLGVTIYINITQDDQPEIDPMIFYMSKIMKTGLQMTLMSNHTHPSFQAVGQSVALLPRMYTAAEVSLTVVMDVGIKTMFDWSETECVPLSKVNYRLDVEAFLNTVPNCDVSSSRFCSKHICNCSIYGLDNSHVNERCRRLCSQYYYVYTSTHLPIQGYIYRNLHDQFSLQNGSDVAVAMAYFPNLHYTEIKRWHKDIDEFMSELGGYMGVFLGCSFVTLIEIFVFFALIFIVLARDINMKLCSGIQPSSSESPSHETK